MIFAWKRPKGCESESRRARGENLGSVCPFLVFCLLLSSPANALFLAGQSEQGGEISVLCEGQSSAFISLPTGGLHALALDSDFQAKFSPTAPGPYTIQCGKETKTISVLLSPRADSGAFSSGENLFLVAGAAIVFLAVLLTAAKVFLNPRTVFSKSYAGGRVRLCLRAAEDLKEIKITDPQGGESGTPLLLSIPHLACGAEWNWEYDGSGEPLLAARLSAKCAKGSVSLISCVEGGSVQKQTMADMGKAEKRKLPKHEA